jgi:hypothetical protein
MTACERKIEEYDNTLAGILSRLTVAGIWSNFIFVQLVNFYIVDVNNEISGFNDNIASISEKVAGLEVRVLKML